MRLEVLEEPRRRAELAVQRRPRHDGRPLQAVQAVGQPEIEVERHAALAEQPDRRLADRHRTLGDRLEEALAELDRAHLVAAGPLEAAADDRVLPADSGALACEGEADQGPLDLLRLAADLLVVRTGDGHAHAAQPAAHAGAELDDPGVGLDRLGLQVEQDQPRLRAVRHAVVGAIVVGGWLHHQRVGPVHPLPDLPLRPRPMRQDRQAQHGMGEDALVAVVAEDAGGDLDELSGGLVGRFEQERLLSVLLEPSMQVAHCESPSAATAITGGCCEASLLLADQGFARILVS